MAVAPDHVLIDGPQANMGLQKLLVDAAAEEGGDSDIKFFGIHVVDQVHQHLLSAALAQVMDQKEDLFLHFLLRVIIWGFYFI